MAKFLTNIDLSKNQLQNAVIHPLGAAPASPSDGQVYYNSTLGNKKLYIYDAQLGAWKSIAGDIESVASSTTGQLVVTGGTGPNPSFAVVTSAVINGGTALATGDQVFDFVTAAIANSSITFSANTGSQVVNENETVKLVGGTGIESVMALNGPVNEITVSQSAVTRTNTASAVTPAVGATFTAIDSVTTDANGNVTAANTKTVTVPLAVTSIDITAGALIDKTGGPITTSGAIQIDVDLSELATTVLPADADFIPVIDSANAQKKIAIGNITLDQFGSPVASINMNSNKIINLTDPTNAQEAATKNYVDTSILGSGALQYQSGYNVATNSPLLDATPIAGIKQGFVYIATTDGLFFTEQLRIGDMLIAEIDSPTVIADWTLVQGNVDLASTTVAGIASFSATNFAVSATGEVTVKNDGIILGTETVGDYVNSITVGAGLDITTATGEGSTPAVTLDLDELTAATPLSTEYVAGIDAAGLGKKFLVSDIISSSSVSFDIIADSSTSVFIATHSLGYSVSAEVFDNNSGSANYGETVGLDIKRVVTGTQFTFSVAPTTGQDYKALIKLN
jgi:hypothetical protein